MRVIAVAALVAACSNDFAEDGTATRATAQLALDGGWFVTPRELAAWDAAFAGEQPAQLRDLCDTLAWVEPAVGSAPGCTRVPKSATHAEWSVHDWAMAVATMYEVSGDDAYLDDLAALDDVLVAARGAYDDVRAAHYAGWVIDRGCKWGSLDVTGLFAGMLARYARIVAERPWLPADVQARASSYALAAARALIDTPPDELADGRLIVTPGAPPACTAQITKPGMPYPYNMDHLVMGAIADLQAARALDPTDIDPLTELPAMWAAWTADALRSSGGHVVFSRWPTGESPDGTARIEDASHAAISVDVLARLDRDGLVDGAGDIAAAAAQTFLAVTTREQGGAWTMPGGMDGTPNPTVYSRAQRACAGWVTLARYDRDVLERCAAITLQVVAGAQPNATASTYAALLAMKSVRRDVSQAY